MSWSSSPILQLLLFAQLHIQEVHLWEAAAPLTGLKVLAAID